MKEVKLVEMTACTNKFKEGDRVRVVRATKSFEIRMIGKTGKVTHTRRTKSNTRRQYSVKFESAKETWIDWFNEVSLELADCKEEGKEMKTGIGGTFEWRAEQFKAYAAAFQEGDAINVDGVGWVEVTSRNDAHGDFLEAGELNVFKLSRGNIGVPNGFISPKGRYLVTTPKDYEVQEGDKLVRLGKTVEQYGQSELTFGKVYEVVRWHEDGELVYKNDMTTALLASYLKEEDGAWGVIPRYENVKAEVFEVDYSGKFKVGDRVKVIATAFEDSGGDIGKYGIVTSISERYKHFAPYLVEFDLGGNEHFNEAELALIERVDKKEEEEMNEKDECVGKFKKGNRVRVTGGYYKGWEGSIDQSDEKGGKPLYTVLFSNNRGYRRVEEEVLELVEKVEKSPEQQAFGLIVDFHDQHEVCGRLKVEVDKIAATALEHNDYDTVRRAIDISEKLEERTK